MPYISDMENKTRTVMSDRMMTIDPNMNPLTVKYREPTIMEIISDALHWRWPQRRFVSDGLLTRMSEKNPSLRIEWVEERIR